MEVVDCDEEKKCRNCEGGVKNNNSMIPNYILGFLVSLGNK